MRKLIIRCTDIEPSLRPEMTEIHAEITGIQELYKTKN
jgi:hypothetical protein